MEEAFRERVPSADFIETCGDHEYFIHTRLLKQYLERWGKQVTSSSPEKKSEWAERTHFVFREATNLLKAVYQEVGQQYPKDFGVYLNLLAVLLETLEYGAARLLCPRSSFLADGAFTSLTEWGTCWLCGRNKKNAI